MHVDFETARGEFTIYWRHTNNCQTRSTVFNLRVSPTQRMFLTHLLKQYCCGSLPLWHRCAHTWLELESGLYQPPSTSRAFGVKKTY